jgi:hypothetical protein
MARAPIKVSIERYAYPRISTMYEVPATLVGDLAVHRPVYWHEGDTPHASDKGWTVSHVRTGLGLGSALPDRVPETTRADLIAWAEAIQAACPAFFAAARIDDRETMKALAVDVRDKGRAL